MIPPFFAGAHTAQVETRSDGGAYGPTYGTAADVPCFAVAKRQLVRTATGEEKQSDVTVYFDPDAPVAEGDRVTALGVTGTVVVVSQWDSGGRLSVDTLEVALT